VALILLMGALLARAFSLPYLVLLAGSVWLVTGLTFGTVRFAVRMATRAREETVAVRWLGRAIAILAAVAALAAFLSVAVAGMYVADGGYWPARYAITVVDPGGRPLPGVEIVLRGERRELRRSSDDARIGYWPLQEYEGRPLRTDARGELVVHQIDEGIQFGSSGCYLYGWDFETSSSRPDHKLEFRHPGFRPYTLDFWDLNRMASDAVGWPASVAVRVVLQPERAGEERSGTSGD